jgi:hypothetical protein
LVGFDQCVWIDQWIRKDQCASINQ